MKGRRAAKEGNLTPEQRDRLKKQIDACVRDRLRERRIASQRARQEAPKHTKA
jgi:hypothetical protein